LGRARVRGMDATPPALPPVRLAGGPVRAPSARSVEPLLRMRSNRVAPEPQGAQQPLANDAGTSNAGSSGAGPSGTGPSGASPSNAPLSPEEEARRELKRQRKREAKKRKQERKRLE